MLINDRIHSAAKILATGEGDARQRVVAACLVLEKLSKIDFQKIGIEAAGEVQALLYELGKTGPLYSAAEPKEVLIDRFTRSSYGRRNATYSKYAERIFLINECVNNQR
jgi:hypothetical protein